MPISDIYGLRAAFDNIAGDPDMLARHARIGAACRAAVRAVGLNVPRICFSNTVTVFDVPKETTADAILQTMRQKHGRSCWLDRFYSLAGQAIRIGHMGSNANVVDMIETLDALDDTLRATERSTERAASHDLSGGSVPKGAGTLEGSEF